VKASEAQKVGYSYPVCHRRLSQDWARKNFVRRLGTDVPEDYVSMDPGSAIPEPPTTFIAGGSFVPGCASHDDGCP
jgi:hypothetical protein